MAMVGLSATRPGLGCPGAELGARHGGRALHCMLPSFRFGTRRRTLLRVQARQPAKEEARRTIEEREPVALATEGRTSSLPASTLLPETPHYIGSPLMWIGVGVGISVLFSWAANYAKKQVMQQALKSMMGTAGPNPFASMPMSGAPPFPFPSVPQAMQSPSSPPKAAVPLLEKMQDKETVVESTATQTDARQAVFTEVASETKGDEVPEDPQAQQEAEQPSVYFKDSEIGDAGPTFGWKTDEPSSTSSSSSSDGKSSPYFTVDTLEKMLEDPAVQQMVYPHLPEEMRNPTTFKWMLQNPQLRSQLQEMLNSMADEGAWKSGQMADILKNFNPNNQELKQQFEQIGLTPEEVMAKMVANPDIAMAFQNPKIQAALFDCSQNPANIIKYQNDKEIMDVFNKIAELFPMKGL